MVKKITTLDIEASGLSSHSYPIEIGVALADGSSWCSLVKPESDWLDWSEQAQSIHGIQRQQLTEYGKNIVTVAQTLNELLEGQTVYSDCWVLDDKWLRKLYHQAHVLQRFRLSDIVNILKEDQFAQWEPTKRQIAHDFNIQRHRATNDARILQEAFYRSNTPII